MVETKPIQIMIADDHQIIIDGIKSLLTDVNSIQVAAEVENGQAALRILESQKIDVVIIDITMPLLNGIEATKQIKKAYPLVKILALTMHEEDHYFKKMMEAGASGYVLKNTGQDELVKAITLVAEGKNFFSNEVYSRIIMKNYGDRKKEPEPVQLTKREIEVLKLIVEELKNHEIAEKLFISTRTVDTHRRNLLQKLNVKNTAGLVKYAIQQGIVE